MVSRARHPHQWRHISSDLDAAMGTPPPQAADPLPLADEQARVAACQDKRATAGARARALHALRPRYEPMLLPLAAAFAPLGLFTPQECEQFVRDAFKVAACYHQPTAGRRLVAIAWQEAASRLEEYVLIALCQSPPSDAVYNAAFARLLARRRDDIHWFAARFRLIGAEYAPAPFPDGEQIPFIRETEQIGAIGLMLAIRGFEFHRGVRLWTYAQNRLRAEQRRATRDARELSEDASRHEAAIRSAEQRLAMRQGTETGAPRVPTAEEVHDELNATRARDGKEPVSLTHVDEIVRYMRRRFEPFDTGRIEGAAGGTTRDVDADDAGAEV